MDILWYKIGQNSVEEGTDTSSATATASDILTGKTAYISDGTEATGTCTFDADTTDATATAADIALGETAYVAGAKLTGTLTVDTLVDTAYIVTSVDADKRPLTVDYYGVVVPQEGFYCYTSQGAFELTTSITMKNNVTSIGLNAFQRCVSATYIGPFDYVTTLAVSCMSFCTKLETIAFPRVSSIPQYAFNASTALVTAQFGSIGYPIASIHSQGFLACTQLGLTITIYVTPGAQPLANSPWGATNATIVYRSAVDGSVL